MENRRRKYTKVSPQYEDAGLFQNATCNLEVSLIPIVRQNHRGDLIITGLVKNDLEIAVTFAGRRALEAAPIVASLQAMRDAQKHVTDVMKSRLPLQIEGTWRPQFVAHDSGFETRTFHFLAAKWSVIDQKGKAVAYGQPPIHLQPTSL